MPPLNTTRRIARRFFKATILCKTFFSDILALGVREFGYFPIVVALVPSTPRWFFIEFEGQNCAFKVAGASSAVWD